MTLSKIATLAMIVAGSAVAQVYLNAGPDLTLTRSVNDSFAVVSSFSNISMITVGATSQGGMPVAVQFQYTGATSVNPAQPTPPNFLVVTPSAGTTSTNPEDVAEILVGLNPPVVRSLSPGGYSLYVNFSTVGQTPAATAHVYVFLTITPPPAPAVTSVVSSASFQPVLAPGGLISIFGSNFGPPVLATQYDDKGQYPTAVSPGAPYGNPTRGNTMVTIGGIAAPLTYVSANQINAMVPYGVTNMTNANVVVTCYDQSSAPMSVPVQATSPGIFTATQNGTGQGAILNVSTSNVYTYNSVDNPAPRGSPVVMYATGAGAWNPAIPDGEIALNEIQQQPACVDPNRPECTQPVNQPLSLTIGGKTAMVFYAGTALYEPWSLLQINAYVPADAPSGQQPVVLKIGQYDNSQQNVTMAVK